MYKKYERFQRQNTSALANSKTKYLIILAISETATDDDVMRRACDDDVIASTCTTLPWQRRARAHDVTARMRRDDDVIARPCAMLPWQRRARAHDVTARMRTGA